MFFNKIKSKSQNIHIRVLVSKKLYEVVFLDFIMIKHCVILFHDLMKTKNFAEYS